MSIINEGIYTLIQNGLVEIIVFALVFAITFGILRKIRLFAKGDEDKSKAKENLNKVKPIHTVISLVLAALTILPHYISRYSAYDIIPLIEESFPKVSLIALAIIGIIVVLGMFGLKVGGGEKGNPVRLFIIVLVFGLIIWIFGGSIDYWRLPYWLSPDLIAVVLAILVFGLVVSFIMSPEKKRNKSIAEAKDGDKINWDKVKVKDMFDDIIKDTKKK